MDILDWLCDVNISDTGKYYGHLAQAALHDSFVSLYIQFFSLLGSAYTGNRLWFLQSTQTFSAWNLKVEFLGCNHAPRPDFSHTAGARETVNMIFHAEVFSKGPRCWPQLLKFPRIHRDNA